MPTQAKGRSHGPTSKITLIKPPGADSGFWDGNRFRGTWASALGFTAELTNAALNLRCCLNQTLEHNHWQFLDP